jgi:hypothetical protein
MMVYGFGFAAIYFCLAALYWNAWRLRGALELTPLETSITLTDLWDKFGVGCIGLLCALIARLLPPEQAGAAGWFFFLIAPWSTFMGYARRRARAALTEPEDLATLPH